MEPARAGGSCSAREITAVALLVGALILALYTIVTEREGLQKDDARHYLQMAQSAEYVARLPYTFRVLSPRLAGLWRDDPLAGFTAVTLISLEVAAVALYAYQRAVGLSKMAALAGAVLFAVSGGAIRVLTTPVYVDALTYASEAAAFLFLATGRFRSFLAAVTIGALNRETALLLIPLYVAANPSGAWRRAATWLVLTLPVAALGAVVLLQLWRAAVLGGDASLGSIAPAARAFRPEGLTLTELFDLFSTFGVLWLLAARNLPGPTELQRRALVFGLLVILQLVVARGDEGRVLSHLFVIVMPLAALEIDRLRAAGARRGSLLALALVVASAASMVHGRWIIFEPAGLRYAIVAAGSLVAIALVGYATWTQRDRAGVPGRAR